MKLLLPFTLVAALLSCKKSFTGFGSDLPSTFVEVTQRRDTIHFKDEAMLIVGTADRQASGIPVHSTGPFMYSFHDNEIAIHWLLSSSSQSNRYYFRMARSQNSFTVGNFYRRNSPASSKISFVRLQ